MTDKSDYRLLSFRYNGVLQVAQAFDGETQEHARFRWERARAAKFTPAERAMTCPTCARACEVCRYDRATCLTRRAILVREGSDYTEPESSQIWQRGDTAPTMLVKVGNGRVLFTRGEISRVDLDQDVAWRCQGIMTTRGHVVLIGDTYGIAAWPAVVVTQILPRRRVRLRDPSPRPGLAREVDLPVDDLHVTWRYVGGTGIVCCPICFTNTLGGTHTSDCLLAKME